MNFVVQYGEKTLAFPVPDSPTRRVKGKKLQATAADGRDLRVALRAPGYPEKIEIDGGTYENLELRGSAFVYATGALPNVCCKMGTEFLFVRRASSSRRGNTWHVDRFDEQGQTLRSVRDAGDPVEDVVREFLKESENDEVILSLGELIIV
jgi:hypothetical protein